MERIERPRNNARPFALVERRNRRATLTWFDMSFDMQNCVKKELI